MRTRLTDDEAAVRDVFAGFFANESPIEVVRAAVPLGHDAALWRKLVEMGAPGMAVSLDAGGGGATLCDLAVVVEQWGRHLAPVPLVEHSVTARLLEHHRPFDQAQFEAIVAGNDIATLALRNPQGATAHLIPAGAVADIIITHDGTSGEAWRSAPPLTAAPNTADLPLASRSPDETTPLDISDQQWTRALDEWRALMAVAHVGLAERAIELGVDYAKERIQFGVPIGSFQAVQHGFADAATRLEGARLLAHRAVWALETNQADASRLAGMALLFSAEMARFAADRSLQYHGGYGFSAEYDIQLYHRHAASWILQLGEPGREYARLADAEFGPRKAA